MDKGLLVVISGPSGAGKGTICKRVIESTGITSSVSVTTRAPRPGEVEGVNYFFRTEEEYQKMIANGEFLETAEVHNNYYGTPKAPVFENLEKGKDVLFEVDVHGAKSIKKKYPEVVLIFVMTPSFKILEERLRARATETESAITTRLKAAKHEFEKYPLFDYLVINDDLDTAVEDVLSIISAEKRRIKNNDKVISRLLAEKASE